MTATDPQFLYMVLVLPALFGLTLLGEGITKLVHHEGGGWISMTFGALFIIVVIFTYMFFLIQLQ